MGHVLQIREKPEESGGRELRSLSSLDSHVGSALSTGLLEEADCTSGSVLANKSLRELNIKVETGVLILGIQNHDGRFDLNPPSDRRLNEGEKLFILGTTEQLRAFKLKYGGI